jgi:hypothetical protein
MLLMSLTTAPASIAYFSSLGLKMVGVRRSDYILAYFAEAFLAKRPEG